MNKIFIPINQHWIYQQLLHQGYIQPFDLDCFIEIPSTNTYLKSTSIETNVTKRRICVAEQQTAGRGRFGRTWSSPYGENIYLSLAWQYYGNTRELTGLSLVVALSIVQCLRKYMDAPCQIKWPNDILCNQQKLAGILIELHGEMRDHIEVIIGIGINVNTNTAKTPLSEHLHCSMYDLTGKYFDRNQLIIDLLLNLEQDLTRFSRHGFSVFQSNWETFDALFHQHIRLHSGSKIVEGIADGVNEQGFLKIISADGMHQVLSSGEASLHFG